MGTGIKDDVLNAFCWMYSTFSIPSNYKGSCSKRVQDPTALYNTYYQVRSLYLNHLQSNSQFNVLVGAHISRVEGRFILPAPSLLAHAGGRPDQVPD